jgi:hypothetical protein
MGFFWGSGGSEDTSKRNIDSQRKDHDQAIAFTDSKLEQFFNNATPSTPVSLASERTKKEYQKAHEPVATHTALGDGYAKPAKKRTLKVAARDNCVEYEAALSQCLLKGTYWERVMSCKSQLDARNTCNDLQEYALRVLEYDQALTEAQRTTIANTADDIMIQHCPQLTISQEQEESFKSAIDAHNKIVPRQSV